MKNRKRFISIVVIVILALMGLSVIGAYVLYDKMFPVAEPVKVPELERVTEITIIHEDGSSVFVGVEDYEELLQNISNTDPTRVWSVNESPSVEMYYTIKMDTVEREYWYYIYTEDSQVYVESPYEGVYKSSQHFLDLLKAYF